MSAANASVVGDLKKKDKYSATCNLCDNDYETSGNTSNLTSHLKKKHHHAYSQLPQKREANDDPTSHQRENASKLLGIFSKKADKDSATCNLCGNDYKRSGNTSNLISHLKKKHHHAYSQLPQKREANDDPTSHQKENASKLLGISNTSYINGTDKNGNSVLNNDIATHDVSTLSVCSSSSKSIQQTVLDLFEKTASYDDGGERHTAITQASVYMIIKDNLPLSCVEKEGLRKFVSTTCSRYKLPSRFKLTQSVEQRYSTTTAILANDLQETKYITVSSDIVTITNSTRSFLIITAHFLNLTDASLNSCCLAAHNMIQQHTGEYIAQCFGTVMSEFSVYNSQIVNMSTDNGSNMIAAVNLFLGIIASDQLRLAQQEEGKKEGQVLMLIQTVGTRWNSCLEMMERFLKLTPLVGRVLASGTEKNVPDMIPTSQLIIFRDLVTLLSPFKVVTEELSAEKYVTASLAIPITNLSKQEIEQTKPSTFIGLSVRKDLSKGISSRLLPLEENLFLSKATILDPRFKKLHFSSALAVANAISDLSKEIKAEHKNRGNISPRVGASPRRSEESTPSLWDRHEHMLRNLSNEVAGSGFGTTPAELKQFLEQPNISRSSNALQFWIDSRHFIPVLSDIALKYLISFATSVAFERVASTINILVPNNRSCQTGEHIKQRVFFKTIPAKYWFP